MSADGDWTQQLAEAITSPELLAARFGVDPEPINAVAGRYPFRITPHFLSLIRQPGDPIWRQCVPDSAECDDTLDPDPLHEENLSPVQGLIHRYPDRVVWLVSTRCAVYCRFCLRKRQVGCGAKSQSDSAEVFAYLKQHPEIIDVVLSGGDPLLLDDEALSVLLSGLRAIPSVKIIRIGTRTPATLPSRITPQLCSLLRQFHPLFINTHFNHPRELTPESLQACGLLADAGIPLGNQTVLLRGINDDAAVMKELLTGLLGMRIKPYYLHQMDLVRGTGHFRTPVTAGVNLLRSMRGHVSGMAIPQYVIDLPGGKGKVPLLPEQVRREGNRLIITTYQGDVVTYEDLKESITVLQE